MLDRMKGPILKNRDEIAVMDRANRVVLEILEIMRAMVKPGVTTAQLNAVAEEELAKRGATSPRKFRNSPSRAVSTSSAISWDMESDDGCTRTRRSTTTASADAVSSCARGWCWRSSRCSVTSVRSCVIASKKQGETARWKT